MRQNTYRATHATPHSQAIRNVLLSFLAYLGLVTVLCTGTYLANHSTGIRTMSSGVIAEEANDDDDNGVVEGTDSGVGCIDDCLGDDDPFDVRAGDSIFFI